MPEGSFAVAETTRRPRAKREKPLTEEQFLALCQKTVDAERAWAAVNGQTCEFVLDKDAPAELVAERNRLAKISGEGYRILTATAATTPVTLRAKAAAILASYYDEPDDHAELYSVVKDVAALMPGDAPNAPGAPDRQIIKLVDEFKRARAKFGPLEDVIETHGSESAKGKKAQAQVGKIVSRGHAIRDRVADIPAVSRDALLAKAWLAKWETSDGDADAGPLAHGYTVAWSLARDVLGGAHAETGVAAAFSVGDAKLITLVNELFKIEAERQKLLSSIDLADLKDAALEAYGKCNEISTRQAQITEEAAELDASSPAGLEAKAKILLFEMELFVEPLTKAPLAERGEPHEMLSATLAQDLIKANSASPSIVTAPIQADAELLRLCEEWQESNYEYGSLMDEANRAEKIEPEGEHSPKVAEIDRRREKLGDDLVLRLGPTIMATKAKTPAGAHAKALVVEGLVQRQMGFCVEDDTLHMISALANDLREMGAAQSASTVNPDAALVALCDEFCDLELRQRVFHDGPNAIADDDECARVCAPLLKRQRVILAQMKKMRASTLEGHLARVRAMVVHGSPCAGSTEDLCNSKYMNESLLGFLLRDLSEQTETIPPPAKIGEVELLKDTVQEKLRIASAPTIAADRRLSPAVQISLLARDVWQDLEKQETGSKRASALTQQWETLADAVKDAPTASVEDALVQICYANNSIGDLTGLEMPADLRLEELKKIERTLFSVTAFLSRHLGADLAAIAEPCDGLHMNPFMQEPAE